MTTQILKTILVGAAIGTALFFMPFFVLKVLIFILVAGMIFRLFGRRRWAEPAGWAYADKIRHMSDEEYDHFKEKFRSHCRGFRNEDDVQNLKGAKA
jgi:hypothetical protein